MVLTRTLDLCEVSVQNAVWLPCVSSVGAVADRVSSEQQGAERLGHAAQ